MYKVIGCLTVFLLLISFSSGLAFPSISVPAENNLWEIILDQINNQQGNADQVLSGPPANTPGTVGNGNSNGNSNVAHSPLPSAAWLLGAGLLGLISFRRRFRKS